MTDKPAIHDGERTVQERCGVPMQVRATPRAIADSLPPGSASFIGNQPMAVIGSRDSTGRIWASIVIGSPGILSVVDERTIRLDLSRMASADSDPLWNNLAGDPDVGLLLIDTGTRRRLRINGRLEALGGNHWVLHMAQAYANCPRYIQRRQIAVNGISPQQNQDPARRGTAFTGDQVQLIVRADTFFVASAHPEHGVDASHRGGNPGFVQIVSDTRLLIPDYPGNNMFNTLGNILCHPHVGLVFIDYQRNRLLQLTGTATIVWHLDRPVDETGGTQRYWEFDCESWQDNPIPQHVDWTFIDHSPFNPPLSDIGGSCE